MRVYVCRANRLAINLHTRKKMHKVIKTLAVLGFAIVAVNSWAGSASIEGIVKDASGKPVNGADVKIWPRYAGTWTKFVKTDANGHYSYDGVAPGTVYVVSLIVHSKIEWSYPSVIAKFGSPTQVNFDLKKTTATAQGAEGTKKVGTKQGSGHPSNSGGN